jgi:hypothetical protein
VLSVWPGHPGVAAKRAGRGDCGGHEVAVCQSRVNARLRTTRPTRLPGGIGVSWEMSLQGRQVNLGGCQAGWLSRYVRSSIVLTYLIAADPDLHCASDPA